MAFRADESAQRGKEWALSRLIPRKADEFTKEKSKEVIEDIIYEYGNVIDSYPTWHPLVSNHNAMKVVTHPSTECGYKALDHTVCFVNAFITCPYGDGQDVIDSVHALPVNKAAAITCEKLDAKLYHPDATPILVKCQWFESLELDNMIPLKLAMPLLLEHEIPVWDKAAVAETWESMRPYFLGRPHGSRSSLFVSQETGQAMKKVWNAIIYTGMYGPIQV